MTHTVCLGRCSISIPEDAVKDYDGPVVSFWRKGHSLLLQLSTYARTDGRQVGAEDRLLSLVARQPLTRLTREIGRYIECPDYAAGRGVDEKGIVWVYAYAVWHDFAIMVTVSGSGAQMRKESNWAFEALRSIKRTTDQKE